MCIQCSHAGMFVCRFVASALATDHDKLKMSLVLTQMRTERHTN